MAVILFAVAWRVLENGRWRDHLALGLTIGLGILSKYNFALLPLGLLFAALALPDLRRKLRPMPLFVSLALAILIVAPYAIWSLHNAEVAGGSLHKLGLATTGPGVARLIGAGAFGIGLLAFLGLGIVVLGPLWFWRDRSVKLPWFPILRFLGLGAGVSLAVLLLLVLIAGGTAVKDRWLLPLAWPLVPVATALLWPVLRPVPQRALAGLVLCLWAAAAFLLPYASLRDPGYRGADYGALLDQVHGIASGTNVVGSNVIWILGNLAYHDPMLTLVRAKDFPDGAFVLIAEPGSVDPGPRAGVSMPYSIGHGNRNMAVEITAIAPR